MSLGILLSHHPKEEYFKCISFKVFNKQIHLCSRCLGFHLVFFPLLLYLLYFQAQLNQTIQLIAIYLLPAPAHINWAITQLTNNKSRNIWRITTGLLLGAAAAVIAYSVIKNPLDNRPYFSFALYLGFALLVFIIKKKKK